MKQTRPLTAAERVLVQSVFGPALALDPVRIHQRKYWMWQPAWITMAPDGHLWFHPNGRDWCADFAEASLSLQGHFIHEMVHVWQHQQGINLRLKRLPFAPYRYLPLTPGKPFHRYGIEQQAEIVKEGFLIDRGWNLPGRPPLATFADLIPFWPG